MSKGYALEIGCTCFNYEGWLAIRGERRDNPANLEISIENGRLSAASLTVKRSINIHEFET